ncbi:SLAM family member 7-like isoform X1 [Myotis daubentonii]|uniref:SLAM family member 7-like isoform X1 n=1 Tax=Myotis daubentonii TaxID=98922 RepID=UPI0028736047|nr:SLAM family member 7-like isoform X1 [Myotis daubentonii]
MPVSPASFSLIFLLCQLTGPAASGAQQELVGAVGGSVTFPLTHSLDRIESIIWFFESTTLITIQPTTTNKPDTVIVTKNHNKGRVGFSHGNYSLKLSKLSKNDSGAYSVQIHSPSLQEPFVQEYGLRVYEHLSKPQITLGLKSNKNGTCVTNLTCFLERGGEDVTYSWKTLGKTSNESHNGSVLPITWTLREKDMTFICMARNPISSNSSNTIFAQKLCEDIAGDLDSTMGLWISLLLIVLILVLIILTMWKQTRKESTEEKRMGTHPEIPNCYPPSGETAEYDTISNPNKTIPEENSVHSPYCTVQIPQKVEKPHSLPTSPDRSKLFIYEKVI